MALLDQLNTDMKVAMKAKDKFKLSVIRMLKAAVQNAEIIKGSALSEDEEIELLARELKQRKESETEFRQADHVELADNAVAEIAIIEEYLPAQLSEAELDEGVKQVIDEVGATSMKDFGKVMQTAVAKFKGQADGNAIQTVAKKYLG